MKTLYTEIYNILYFLVVSIITFLAPIWGVLFTVYSFVLVDTIIAYQRVKKTKKVWTSKKLRVGLINKGITYLTFIVLFFLTDKFIFNSLLQSQTNIEYFATKIVTLIFIYIEYTSINESFVILKGISLYDKLKEMLGYANHIKNDLKNINKDKEL